VLTASSTRQADRYMDEIRRRQHQGKIPPALYLAVPDAGGRRIGSGGATLNALRELDNRLGLPWENARVLIIHSGGDSRRLPQYSLSGKLFGALPVTTVWGEVSTVFDEFLALSSSWAARLPAGLVVASGDVVLTFDSTPLDWSRPESWTGALDRSPCGTGTCARMAVMHAKGQLGLYEDFVHEGILGTTFTGRLLEETRVGPYAAVVPSLSGPAIASVVADYISWRAVFLGLLPLLVVVTVGLEPGFTTAWKSWPTTTTTAAVPAEPERATSVPTPPR
jgi:hypothetical protein